jgi:hypothetical protein
MSYRKEQQEKLKISEKAFKLLLHKFTQAVEDGIKELDFTKFVISIRDELEVNSSLQGIIFGYSFSNHIETDIKKCQNKLQEFYLVKKALGLMSIQQKDKKILQPKILKAIIRDLVVHENSESKVSLSGISGLALKKKIKTKPKFYSGLFTIDMSHLVYCYRIFRNGKSKELDISDIKDAMLLVLKQYDQEKQENKEARDSTLFEDGKEVSYKRSSVSNLLHEADNFMK